MGDKETMGHLMGDVSVQLIEFMGCCNIGYVTDAIGVAEHLELFEDALNAYLNRLRILGPRERVAVSVVVKGDARA